MKWAHWLAETIPGAKPPVELEGARIFPEERADEFNRLLRDIGQSRRFQRFCPSPVPLGEVA